MNFKPLYRAYSFLSMSRLVTLEGPSFKGFLPREEFDLREEVMLCIAESIGFLQPPISGGESAKTPQAFPRWTHCILVAHYMLLKMCFHLQESNARHMFQWHGRSV